MKRQKNKGIAVWCAVVTENQIFEFHLLENSKSTVIRID